MPAQISALTDKQVSLMVINELFIMHLGKSAQPEIPVVPFPITFFATCCIIRRSFHSEDLKHYRTRFPQGFSVPIIERPDSGCYTEKVYCITVFHNKRRLNTISLESCLLAEFR